MTFSVCTIARGREAHLHNMIRGLAQQSLLPAELVIAHMQPMAYADLPESPFPIRQIPVGGTRLPLSSARNAAAAQAHADNLIFLDVDCIPMPGLIAGYGDALESDRCLMGNTHYLARNDCPLFLNCDALWRRARQHPARHFGEDRRSIPQTTEFWSLSFAMEIDSFWKIGGFDPAFEGYGGEDTDFAMRLATSSIDLYWVPEARAVHQWHPVQIPAYNHFEDIIRNANLFYRKHGRWCMEYWLEMFESAGLIRISDGLIEILRQPSTDERERAIQNGSVRFG